MPDLFFKCEFQEDHLGGGIFKKGSTKKGVLNDTQNLKI